MMKITILALVVAFFLSSAAAQDQQSSPGPTPSAAAPADQDTIQQPVLRSGAVYQYQVVDLLKNEIIETVEQTVLSVESNKARLQGTSSKGRQWRATLDLDHQTIPRRDQKGAWQAIKFPISVGETWKYEYSYPCPYEAGSTCLSEIRAKFVGWEEVKTPAGAYRAAKLVHEGYWSTGQWRGRESYTFWFSPGIGRFVKEYHDAFDSRGNLIERYERRLAGYRSAPEMSTPFALPK
jgi:hypothetical protein